MCSDTCISGAGHAQLFPMARPSRLDDLSPASTSRFLKEVEEKEGVSVG